jgi:hypothetical protein
VQFVTAATAPESDSVAVEAGVSDAEVSEPPRLLPSEARQTRIEELEAQLAQLNEEVAWQKRQALPNAVRAEARAAWGVHARPDRMTLERMIGEGSVRIFV